MLLEEERCKVYSVIPVCGKTIVNINNYFCL